MKACLFQSFLASVLLLIFGLIAFVSFGLQLIGNDDKAIDPPETNDEQEAQQTAGIVHNPPSLDDVPDGPLGEAILRGYELTNNTSEILRAEAATVEDGERAVNGLSCTSCHADLPWGHVNNMENPPTPNVNDGEALYQKSCISCHAGDGAGTGSNTGPALWGDDSFNDGAGIARMTKMAGYIQRNMPLGAENSLSDQEASDLAAYILSQDRPEWPNHDKDWPGVEPPSDIMTKERRDQVKDGTVNWDEVLGNE